MATYVYRATVISFRKPGKVLSTMARCESSKLSTCALRRLMLASAFASSATGVMFLSCIARRVATTAEKGSAHDQREVAKLNRSDPGPVVEFDMIFQQSKAGLVCRSRRQINANKRTRDIGES